MSIIWYIPNLYQAIKLRARTLTRVFPWTVVAAGGIGLALMTVGGHSGFYTGRSIVRSVSSAVEDLGDQRQLCDLANQPGGEVRFVAQVKPSRFSNYQGVFQTSSLNSGIRIELNEFGLVTLVASTRTGEYALIENPVPLALGIQNEINVRIISGVGVSLQVNDQTEQFIPSDPSFNCSNFKIGVGYEPIRKFEGLIELHVYSGNRTPLVPYSKFLRLLGQLLFFTAVASTFRTKLNREGTTAEERVLR